MSNVTSPTASRWPIIKYGERRGHSAGMLELRDGLPRIAHAPRRIDDEHRLEVRLFLIFLDVVAVGLAEGPPVDVADLVAGAVLAMLGELDREPLERALVQARHDSLDHQPREQLQPAEAGQGGGVEIVHESAAFGITRPDAGLRDRAQFWH